MKSYGSCRKSKSPFDKYPIKIPTIKSRMHNFIHVHLKEAKLLKLPLWLHKGAYFKDWMYSTRVIAPVVNLNHHLISTWSQPLSQECKMLYKFLHVHLKEVKMLWLPSWSQKCTYVKDFLCEAE